MINGFDQCAGLGWVNEKAVHIGAGTPVVSLRVAKERRLKPGGTSHLRSDTLDRVYAAALDEFGNKVVVYLRTNVRRVHTPNVNAVSAHAVVNIVA